jgi:hypothetical protein
VGGWVGRARLLTHWAVAVIVATDPASSAAAAAVGTKFSGGGVGGSGGSGGAAVGGSKSYDSSKQQADAAKQRGNEALKCKKYHQAVSHYTEAIVSDPTNHLFYRCVCQNFDPIRCAACRPWDTGVSLLRPHNKPCGHGCEELTG